MEKKKALEMHKQRKGTPFFRLNREPQYQEEKKEPTSPHSHLDRKRAFKGTKRKKKLLSISPQQER